MDLKYDILRHPKIHLTVDGGAAPYMHGEDTRSYASVLLSRQLLEQAKTPYAPNLNIQFFCEEELEEHFENLEEHKNENEQHHRKRK